MFSRRGFIGALIALPFVKELPKAGLRYSPIPTYAYGIRGMRADCCIVDEYQEIEIDPKIFREVVRGFKNV